MSDWLTPEERKEWDATLSLDRGETENERLRSAVHRAEARIKVLEQRSRQQQEITAAEILMLLDEMAEDLRYDCLSRTKFLEIANEFKRIYPRAQVVADILLICPQVADVLWCTILREGSSREALRGKFLKAVAKLKEVSNVPMGSDRSGNDAGAQKAPGGEGAQGS